jgi:hypothetical protein
LSEKSVEKSADPGQDGDRTVLDVRFLFELVAQAAGQVGHGHTDLGSPQLGNQDSAGVGAKAQHAWRPSAGGLAELALFDQPDLHQLVEALDYDVAA